MPRNNNSAGNQVQGSHIRHEEYHAGQEIQDGQPPEFDPADFLETLFDPPLPGYRKEAHKQKKDKTRDPRYIMFYLGRRT
jgi:hypothetical protein